MNFDEKLIGIAEKVQTQQSAIQTEEATKIAFVMPFIKDVLGYDVFNPLEVVPEFTADVGTKRGEKVDYAILKEGQIQILIESKKHGDELNINHASQLYRYFSVTTARIAILTNGQVYKFYTDLDAPNKMDDKPFLVLDLLDLDDHAIPELKKITKSDFDLDSIISAAGELKYVSQIKRILNSQFSKPDDDLVRFFASRVYDGVLTQRIREQFLTLTQKALRQFLTDQVNERLKLALAGNARSVSAEIPEMDHVSSNQDGAIDLVDDGVVTTIEEIEGFNIVKAIVRSEVDVRRIVGRDTKSYFGVLLDDNNRRPICRLHFNRSQKYIGVFDADKKETRHPIGSLDDIFSHSEIIKETAKSYG